jgi:hypothetical protein
VHWQAGERPLPASAISVAGESMLWVDPAEVPSGDDIGRLCRALGAGPHGERHELMANTAAYSGLRWGKLTALTIPQVDEAGRVITMDRKVVEVAGHLALLALAVLVPDTTPAAFLLAGRVHGDAVLQLDDLSAAADSGAPGPAGEEAPGCRVPGLGPLGQAGRLAAARLWDFCGNLEGDGCCLRHAASLDSCVPAARRAGLVVCPGGRD